MADTNNQYSFLDYEGLSLFWNNIKNIIEDNELVTATALTDLDTRVDNLEESTSNLVISKTYLELVELKGNYVPGQQYRITDYVTTTMQANTQSAGHQFDLIVTADDESTLNENARAIQHTTEESDYFAGQDLSAWEIKYCLDNDRDRFDWAVTAGRSIGVDLPVLWEGIVTNITAILNGTFVYNGTTYARWDGVFQGVEIYILTPNEDVTIGSTPIVYAIEASEGVEGGTITSFTIHENDGKGVIYRMIDEFNNDVPYDFKNIQFLRKITDGALDLQNGADIYCYTFSDFSSGVLLDTSFAGSVSNVFGENCWDNVFLGNSCHSNSFGNDCRNNSFGNGCYSNSFGNTCYSNSFGNECYGNSFGNECIFNSFGNECYGNSFGNECSFNSFGNECNRNSFENGCYSNSFGNKCYGNSFGNICHENSFGNSCYTNSFGNGCYSNSFGDSCTENSFGNDCSNNSFGDSCPNNSFGNHAEYNSFGNDCYRNSFGNNCRHNSFGQLCSYNSFENGCYNNSFRTSASTSGDLRSYCYYNHFDDGCSYNVIWNNIDDSSNTLQNINVNRGVSGTNPAYNFININTLNSEQEINVNQVDGIISIGEVLCINYESLKSLRDNSQLIPGRQYRIIDYVTTTVQANTQVANPYHQFDLIVTADSENTLNENARAIQHEGDTYFANTDITAWEIKYCLDNDTDRFAWANNTENGKGVIYYMKDEYGNECPYDFKNIMFIRYQLEAPTTSGYSNQWINQLATNISRQFTDNQLSYIWGGIDEYNRYWEDFSIECYSPNTGTTKAFYTFSNIIDDNVSDKSITKYCYNNVIKEYSSSQKLCLNNNVFFNTSDSCYSNSFGYNCYSNSFGNDCYDNSFGNECYGNSFGNICRENSFGNYCYSNSFGDGCQFNSFENEYYYNSFGNNCYFNSFGNEYYYNSFGNDCYRNSFGNNCSSNSFRNNCFSNSFGNECYSNSFGGDCYHNSIGNAYRYNSFGNNCNFNSFGNNCSSNSFGNNCSSNSFGNGCLSNSFGTDCCYNSFGDGCQYNSFRTAPYTSGTLKHYCYYNHFDDGCSFNVIWNNETASSSVQLKNINVNRGVSGTRSSYNFINIDVLNSEQEINVNQVDGIISIGEVLHIKYETLKSLRGNSQLIPGRQYRIIDYVTTTKQANTQVANPYHQFDLIVTADSENTLNENAMAIQHEGDTYFVNSDLNAWEIKYCIDNDTTRFAWADDTDNGKGVIYYMKDEYGNECPYDFKNIMFIRYQLEAPATSGEFGEQWINQLATNISAQFNDNQLSYIWGGLDENDRYWELDFSVCYSPNTGTTKAFYTFSNIIDDNVSDKSITKHCYNNVIKEYIRLQKLYLNNNVFFNTSDSCYSNSFGYNCYSNSFGKCYNNSFGNYCYSNSFGNGCYGNSFGNDCYYNSFGNNCHSNSFENEYYYNSFGNGCYFNSFGNEYYYNSFGNDCRNNSFGNGCYSNSFGNTCYSNSFGNECYGNSFGNEFNNNSFGNNCYYNSFGDLCLYNSFGNGCQSNVFEDKNSFNSFGNSCDNNHFVYLCQHNSFGNFCSSNYFGDFCLYNSFGNECNFNSFRTSASKLGTLKDYCCDNHFDDGCSYNVIWNNETASSSVQLKNINVNRGVSGTSSSYNFINITTLNSDEEIHVDKQSNGNIYTYTTANIVSPIVNQTATSVTIQPNVYNKWGEMTTLTISLASPTYTSIVNEYMIEFLTGSTATTLSLPSTLEFVGGRPNIETNRIYQISIINNAAVMVSAPR